MMKRIAVWTGSWRVWLAICALAVMAFPTVALVAAMSIIGIPIAIVLALIPGVAFLLLPAAFLKDRIAHLTSPLVAWIVAVCAVLAAAALAASAINAGLDRKVATLRAGDRDAIAGANVRTIALVSHNPHRRRDDFACAGACLRLLLTDAADEVLIAGAKDLSALDDAVPAIAARFEKGGACAAKRVPDDDLSIDGEPSRAAEFARRRIAAGDCLVERDSNLGEADAIIAYGAIDEGKSAYDAGLNALADAVGAVRLSYLRRAGGAWREDYRSTSIEVHKHPPILFPTIVTGYAFNAKAGFARIGERTGFASRYEEAPDLAAFLEKKLQLKIRLEASAAPDQSILVDTLIARTSGPLSAAELAVVDDFYSSFLIGTAKNRAREDAERATSLLERLDYELASSAPSAARAIANANPDLAGRIVAAQFQRLFATDAAARESRYGDRYISRIATTIAILPDPSLLLHRADFARLASDAERRSLAAPVLARLAIFGAEAEADVIGLIGAALSERDGAPDNDDRWRDLYRAGLSGVCKLASKKGAAALEAAVAGNETLGQWPHRDLLVNALLAAGESDDRVRARLTAPSVNENADERDRSDLDRLISHARRRPDCAY
ncbi:MAG: hypothetical protein ACKVS5_13525 [Parvularculaceae bacterium]